MGPATKPQASSALVAFSVAPGDSVVAAPSLEAASFMDLLPTLHSPGSQAALRSRVLWPRHRRRAPAEASAVYPHAAFTLPPLGTPLPRVVRIQSSATDACNTNASANDVTESAAICSSLGSAASIKAGTKIRRIVAIESPMAKARIIHSL